MSRSIPALVRPALLVWAREKAGWRPEEAAAKLRTQVERLREWERGAERPSIAQLRKLGELYKRPLAVFFLPEPPRDFDPQREFRRLRRTRGGSPPCAPRSLPNSSQANCRWRTRSGLLADAARSCASLLRIPKRNRSRRPWVPQNLGGCWPVDLCNEWRVVSRRESHNPWHGVDEVPRQLRIRRAPYDDKQCHSMSHDSRKLVRRITDPGIVRYRHSAVLPDVSKPLLIGAIGRKTIVVPLDRQPRRGQDFGESLTKIAVGEEDQVQAARSYSTASSISGRSRP